MEDINLIFKNQKEFFESGKTINVDYRIKNLKKLNDIIKKNEDKILNELKKDLGKSNFEGYVTEVGILYDDINFHIKNVKKWSSEEKRKSPIVYYPSKSYIYKEPYGVTLIIGPFNYPFQLVIAPLIGAISAGNTAIIKPSENSRNIALLLEKLINENFPEGYLRVVNPLGGKETVSLLLDKPFDYIFFTGSVRVGKLVMQKAAQHLTPVTLELGGKSPCIVDSDAKLKLAAKRIVWGKFLNAGQTCISIDYVLIHEKVKNTFIKELFREIKHRYKNAAFNSSYPKIINRHHYNRLKKLLASETKVIGGICNDTERKISPAILPDTDFDKPVMQEEIFGPLLPIISYRSLDKAIQTLKTKEKPLACYVFTKKKATANKIIHEISYGGGCINDVVIHISNHNLPFGGVGNSGIGGYHGKYSFETFSHRKSIVKSSGKFDIPLRYAPYGTLKYHLLKRFL